MATFLESLIVFEYLEDGKEKIEGFATANEKTMFLHRIGGIAHAIAEEIELGITQARDSGTSVHSLVQRGELRKGEGNEM